MSVTTCLSWALGRTLKGIWGAKKSFVLALSLAGLTLSIPFLLCTLAWSLSQPILSVPIVTEITVFPDRTISAPAVETLSKKIAQSRTVQSIRIISKQDALKQVNDSLGIKTRNAKANPLPDIIIVTCKPSASSHDIHALATKIETLSYVDTVAFDDSWAKHLGALKRACTTALGILAAIVFMLILFVISTSIRLTTNAQQDEIRALYLFGATNTFIKRPFVWRGTLTLTLAALMSIAVTYFALELLKEPITDFASLYGVKVTLTMLPTEWCVYYVIIAALCGMAISHSVAGELIKNELSR